MKDYTPFSPRASLVAAGVWTERRKIWYVVEDHVHIRQKVIRYRPIDKLKDAFINVLAGGHGIVEINTRLRHDEAVQHAFGRDGCAEQSVVSDTLNACGETEVEQMRQAQQVLLRTHGRAYHHNYDQQCQVLDIDLTGMPAGRQGEGVTKGYFSGHRARGAAPVAVFASGLIFPYVAHFPVLPLGAFPQTTPRTGCAAFTTSRLPR